MTNTPIIKLSGLNYKLGSRYLLDNIHWEVQPGEHWVVFGLNGSGKTTLLSIIAGFGPYTNGSVEVLGQHYGEDTTLALRRKIGFVSSSFFDKYYTGEVVLNIVLSGLSGTLGVGAAIQNHHICQARRLLQQMDMAGKIAQPFRELSKGERQKVLIARALIAEPEILLLDEPGTGLDVYARDQLLTMVRRLAKKQLTIIYVTHYPEEILDIFEHCLLLKQGRIYRSGLTESLFTAETLSTFLNYPVRLKRELGHYYLSVHQNESENHADE